MSVLVSLTICLSAAIGVLQLSGFYCVGQAVLIQNFNEQRICQVCKGWTEAFYDVPLYTFLGEGRAYKVVRIYAKSPYTDHPGKFHQKMVRKTPKKSQKVCIFIFLA